MPVRVEMRVHVQFEARDDMAAKAAVMRIPGDLKVSIEYGKLGGAFTGVTAGSAVVDIVEKAFRQG